MQLENLRPHTGWRQLIESEMDGLKKVLTMNPTEKQITKISTTSDNITYLVDSKNNLCQHNKFHP